MNNSLGKDALRLTIAKCFVLVISMLTTILLSRFRTLEEYGTYSQLMIVINLAVSIFMLGVPSSINYFMARADNKDKKREFLSVYYSLSSVLSILVGFILLLGINIVVAYFENSAILSFWFVFLIFPWTTIVASSVENLLIIYKKTSQLMIYRVINSVLQLGILIISEYFSLNFEVYMILLIIIQMIMAIAVIVMANNFAGGLYFSLKGKLLKQILSYSLPLGLATIVSTINIELDKLMIGSFLTTEDLAIYTNAAKEMPVVIVASSITAVLLPTIAREIKEGKNKEAVALWKDATILSYICICFFVAILVVFAPNIIDILYSNKYAAGVSVFRVYSLVLLLRCTYFGMILSSMGKTKFIFLSSILSLIINVILNFIMYFNFGFVGPAIATFISMMLVGLFQLIATSKVIEIKLSRIFPWKKLFEISLINLVLGVVFYLVYMKLINIFNMDFLIMVIIVIVWSLLYLVIMFKQIKKYWNKLNSN